MLLCAPVSPQMPDLRATAHLVVAPTTVTDAAGEYVDGLNDKDFVLYDNGLRRDIRVDVSYFPISLVIAVECNSYSAAALNKTRLIGSMIEPLVTGERGDAAVVAFDGEVRVAAPFSSNFPQVQAVLRGLAPGDDGAKIIDAVAQSIQMLAGRPVRNRKVILLISEAKDRGSKNKLEEVITHAERENVTIYPVTYSAYTTAFTAKAGTVPPPSEARINIIAIMREIARLAKVNTAEAFSTMTGGRRHSFTRQRGLEQAIARLGEELHAQYLLSFAADSRTDAAYHAIKVEVAGRPELAVRTRPGYWMALP
jgi:VWFA-related protein